MTFCIVSWERVSKTLLGYMVIIIMVTLVNMGEIRNCTDTQKQCMTKMGCNMAIHNYLSHCQRIIHGDVRQCTYHCKIALLSLLTTESHGGQNFNTCDCQGSEFCILQRDRLMVCQDEVMSSINEVNDPDTPLSCSLAVMICSADTSCLTALNYYHQHCRRLIKGEKCTSRCNNSLAILYRQPKAFKLRNCICDGKESYDCPKLRNSTETLCFGDRKQRQQNHFELTTQRMRHLHHHNHTRSPQHTHKHHSGHNGVSCTVSSGSKTYIYPNKSALTANERQDLTSGAGSAGNLFFSKNQNVQLYFYLLISFFIIPAVNSQSCLLLL